MKMIFVALIVGLLVTLGFRACHSTASAKMTGKKEGGFFGAFSQAAKGNGESERLGVAKDGKRATGAYDVWQEKLRWESGVMFLRTDVGQYEVGRMSVHGLVLAIDRRVAKVAQPDGRMGFVVCDDSSSYLPGDREQNAASLQKSGVVRDTAAASPASALFRTGSAESEDNPQKYRVVGAHVLPVGAAVDSQGDVNSSSSSNHVPYGPKPAPWSGVPGW